MVANTAFDEVKAGVENLGFLLTVRPLQAKQSLLVLLGGWTPLVNGRVFPRADRKDSSVRLAPWAWEASPRPDRWGRR